MGDESRPALGTTLTAFRAVEKHFQLRKLPSKQSRLHAVSSAADDSALLQGVLDFQGAACGDALAAGSVQCHTASALRGQRIWTLAAHPGLVVMPGVLTPAEQRRIAADAFTAWPGPPNRTNHSAHLGALPGLWRAAQAGSRLSQRPGNWKEPAVPSEQAYSHAEQQDTSKRQKSNGDAHSPPLATIQFASNDGALHSCETASQQRARPSMPYEESARESAPRTFQQAGTEHGGGQPSRGDASKDSARGWEHAGSHVTDHCSGAGNTWCQSGGGPTARQLLSKLRWATLGPPYDWTRREYAAADRSPTLPEYLRDLAVRLAAAASGATAVCGPPLGGAAAGGSGCSAPLEGRAAEFQPNAALVNYYQSDGDTLCGHQDDAEGALEQPLVSLSVGCDAVFLIGGLHREVSPTALLLRSGDVLVMAGESRRCFHGVPRVLLGRPAAALASQRQAAQQQVSGDNGEGSGDEMHTVCDHMAAARLNISVRQVVPRMSAA